MSPLIHRGWILCAGVGLGVVILSFVFWIFTELHEGNPIGNGPHFIGVQATASASNGSFSAATGRIDEDVEGLFLLDPLTGELSCYILNVFNLQFTTEFRYKNVLQDLGMEKNQQASLLLLTGIVNFKLKQGREKPSAAIVYVVDSATGNFAAYAVPWTKNFHTSSQKKFHTGSLRLLHKGSSRKQ